MNRNFNLKLINIAVKILFVILLAYFVSFAAWIYLPKSESFFLPAKSFVMPYNIYRLNNMLNATTITPANNLKQKKSINIENMALIGLYGIKNYGFIVVAMKKDMSKTYIISIGEEFKGYKLISIGNKSATFTKNNQRFVLNMTAKKIKMPSYETPVEASGIKDISYHLISYYMKHPKNIWRNISINDYRQNSKLTGFIITWINPRSVFATLGLKKGDIITQINNHVVHSYKDVFDVYNHINQLHAVELVVKRGNKKLEFTYAIN